jgi:F-type H+-transporting ATPase subunit c
MVYVMGSLAVLITRVPKSSHVLLLIFSQLPAVRNFQTTAVTRDIDSAAKFIGAGAATVGVAGSGMCSL